jgi:hypothetical protein
MFQRGKENLHQLELYVRENPGFEYWETVLGEGLLKARLYGKFFSLQLSFVVPSEYYQDSDFCNELLKHCSNDDLLRRLNSILLLQIPT